MAHMQANGDIVDHRQVAEQADVLEGARHAEQRILLGPIACDIPAAKYNAPTAGLEDAGQEIEGRGLAGAIGTDEANQFAVGDREIELLQRSHAAEVLAELDDFKRRLAAGRHAPPSIHSLRLSLGIEGSLML